jgi:precorrin-2 methylase
MLMEGKGNEHFSSTCGAPRVLVTISKMEEEHVFQWVPGVTSWSKCAPARSISLQRKHRASFL